jgi:hypothetical protein
MNPSIQEEFTEKEDALKRFIQRFSDKITGALSGFDRLVLRGSLRQLKYPAGMKRWLWDQQVLLKEFGAYAETLTERLKQASCQEAQRQSRPVLYLASSHTDKEALAREIAERDRIREGLIAVLRCVEPCSSYEIYRNRDTKRLELVPRFRKCLHLYHYFIDPQFGFMSARVQTWLAFDLQICLNGREWLARQMDRAGLRYHRQDNCFTWLENVEQAQRLMDRQLKTAWPRALQRIVRRIHPAHRQIFRHSPLDYYWSAFQSEWATDVTFKTPSALAEIYPAFVTHAMSTFSSADVMRFLGRKVHGAFRGEIVTDFKDRVEGIRVKHRVHKNSVKMYDKFGNLRVETTINDPADFKVFRPKQNDPSGECDWRPLRRGIADLHRRAQVSQASNERYLDALAATDTSTPLGELVRSICRPVILNAKRVRALRPWAEEDLALFRAVTRGEFSVNGFRNRDLQARLFVGTPPSAKQYRRRSSRVSRLLRMLRAHHLIKRVPSTYRYLLTPRGRDILSAILTTQRVTLEQLNQAAA